MGMMIESIVTNVLGGSTRTQDLKKKSTVSMGAEGEGKTGSAVLKVSDFTEKQDIDKEENDRLLVKMQLASTRLEVMGEHFKAMQTVKRECGSDGLTMYRRISKLISTADEYKKTDHYKEKKDVECLTKDQVDALEAKRKEIQKKKDEKQEKTEEEQSVNAVMSDEDKVDSKSEEIESTEKTGEVTENKVVQENHLTETESNFQKERVAELYQESDETLKYEGQNVGSVLNFFL